MRKPSKTVKHPNAVLASTAHGPATPNAPADPEIALRAYELYIASGAKPGLDAEYWLEAERQLRREGESRA